MEKSFAHDLSKTPRPSVDKNLEKKESIQKVTTIAPRRGPLLTLDIIKKQFKDGVNLPVMPSVANRLLEIRSADSIDVNELVYLLTSDPVISAKIMAYASSPFFAYQGKLASIEEAIFHVLGMDLAINTALAIALGQQFKGPLDGPLGAHSTWRHAVYCAVLSQSIATSIGSQHKVSPSTAYLYGLLHNIGFLALGHLFPKRFSLFNKAVDTKKEYSVSVIEKKLLGVSHTQVGSLLVDSWNMPSQYKTIIEHHHDFNYQGEHAAYVHILYLANTILKTHQIGDASDSGIPEQLLEKYNIGDSELQNMLEIAMSWHENLDHLSQQLVA